VRLPSSIGDINVFIVIHSEDPATDVVFPTTLELPGTPKLSLLGLGVRTVSFLRIKVYSVGFYADLRQAGFTVGHRRIKKKNALVTIIDQFLSDFQPRLDGTPDEQIEHIVRNTTCALRIGAYLSTSRLFNGPN
jgi:hypothetical protein